MGEKLENNKRKSVNKLIKAFKAGDKKALEELMLLTYKNLFLLAHSYLNDKMLAEDIVSETFIKLIEKCHTIKNEQNFNGYLRTIVINKSLDLIRKRKHDFFPGDEVLCLKAAEQDNGQIYVRQALSFLSGNEREVLLLWHYGYTLDEISKKTGYTINQVRLLLKKAKENFVEKYHKSMVD